MSRCSGGLLVGGGARREPRAKLAEILEHWGRIINSEHPLKYINMAHSDMFLSVEMFKERYNYFTTLWHGLHDIHAQGLSVEEAKKIYTIERDFPYFKDKRLHAGGRNIHEYNIEAIWERIAE